MSVRSGFLARMHRPAGAPEESVPMRLAVGAAVEIAILAVVVEGGVSGAAALLPLLLAPIGYFFSYQQRHRSNITTKVLLSVGLLAAFAQFLQSVRLAGSVDQARIPLASLFLWVQVLHAFDVPRRRDLAFSIVSSVILMAEAGTLSFSTSFALLLIPWAACTGVWLFLSSRPPAGSLTQPTAVRRKGADRGIEAPLRTATFTGAVVLVASTLVFMAIPRLPGTLVRSLPFSLSGPASSVANFAGGVENPSLPARSGDGVVDFAPNAYPGFSDVVDLRARGHLSDELAFRVRAPQAALWRAEAFDTYDGTRWTIAERSTEPLVSDGAPSGAYTLPPSVMGGIGPVPLVRVTQTFFVESQQPNVLFAAAVPEQVYFPSGGLRSDPYGSIRSPILLDPGLIYSVVSDVPVTTPSVLRLSSAEGLASAGDGYLQVPPELPQRVRDLTARVVGNASTEFDRVVAVQAWLRTHTRYDLDIPLDPPGVDAVDHFLFVTRRGFCEQIATSMAVMLRTLGIPTRLVTGYGPGERNPLTGYFEVRQSDAHAWVEVFYPGVGWVPYDPTFGVPDAAPRPASRFIGGEVLAALGRFVSDAVPEPVKRLFHDLAGGLAVLRDHAVGALPPLIVVGTVVGLLLWRRRRRRSRRPGQPVALGAYLDLTDVLADRGHPLVEHATPREYLQAIAKDPAIERAIVEEAEVVVSTLERDRFSGRPAADADLVRAREAVVTVRELVSGR
jgi:transglutaminase-like putative cysteine protease